MRKESIGRLLLSFITAFVMIVGVFTAAVYNNAVDWENESTVNSEVIAPSEPDEERSEVGEAPTSANYRDNTNERLANMRQEIQQTITSTPISDRELRNDQSYISRPSQSTSMAEQTLAEEYGTRIAPGAYVDAGGPYGTPDDPMEEGNATVFWATIYEDDPLNYEYRWDIDDNGEYETEWSADPFYFHTFTDDHEGTARVQAYDGTSYWVTNYGIPLQEDVVEYSPRYYEYSDTVTYGWEFETSKDIRITDLGFLRDSNVYGYWGPAPEYVYKLTIWDAHSWTRLVELEDANGFPYVEDSWNWFSVSPAYDLPAGSYMMSCHVKGNDPYYPNSFPGIQNPFSSPDGVVEIGDRYMIDYDYYPYWWDGTWSSPAVDFKYEWDELIEVYLEDTAEVYVANVVPDVYDCTAIPPDALGSEGSPVEFTAKFKDPGIGDDWWFRYDWGDGEVSEWIRVPEYEFDEPVENVLYFYDGPDGRNFGGLALEECGIAYTELRSWEDFEDELESGVEWDLVFFQNPWSWMDESVFDALNDYVVAGGKLIINTWLTWDYMYNPLWNNLGAYFGWDYVDDAPDIYEWDMSHDIFNFPHDVPTLVGTDMYTFVCGQYIQEIDGFGHPVAGYYPTDDPYAWYEAGLIARLDKQTIWNAFTPCNYNADEDGDGNIDMQELMVNEILWVLGGIVIQPWPEPIDLPAYPHIFKDDHPDTLTDMDQFNVKVEVRDDDHVDEYTGPGTLWYEDFESGFGDWSQGGGWELQWWWWAGDGHTAQAHYWSYYPYTGIFEDSLESPVIDLSGLTDSSLEFEHFWQSDYPDALYQDGYVEASIDGGITWPYLIDEFHMYDPGWELATKTYDISSWADGESKLRIRFRMSQYDNEMWEVDNIKILGQVYIPGVPGMGTDDCWVTIQNVYPELYKPAEFMDIGKENRAVNFGVIDEWGLEITDPALWQESESFWYKIDYGDGTVTEWMESYQLMPGQERNDGHVIITGVPMDFPLFNDYSVDGAQQLMYNILMYCLPEGEGTILCSDTSWYMQSHTPDQMESNLNNNFGTNYDFIYAYGWIDLVDDFTGEPIYDMLYFSYDWSADFGDIWYTLDEVTEYIEAGGHVFLPGDEYGPGVIWFLPWYVEYPSEAYQDFYDEFPGPAFVGVIENAISAGVYTGEQGWGAELHNDIKGYDESEFLPIFADPDPITTLVRPGDGMRYPKNLIVPETHLYGDNGKYEVNIMIIDDDMWWDLSGEQPEFMGTGDPNDWISHNRFEVEIENTDPVILPDIKAYAQLDLRLRISGTKDCDATMTLYETHEGTTTSTSTSVTRDPGSPDIGIMPSVDLMVTKDYEYELVVGVMGGSGGNPTWIFDIVFPDGKYKEFKHTFNDENGWTWTITSSELKAALLGHDIIFEATARDVGSDDLAFIWNFGDCTPHGIHLYANSLYNPALPSDPINGESDEAEVMFTQLGTLADPWFEYDDNDERSPELNPMIITDTISHVFDENQPYYYYVTLIVMDDDVGEPYPSTQLHPTSGLDCYPIEINLG